MGLGLMKPSFGGSLRALRVLRGEDVVRSRLNPNVTIGVHHDEEHEDHEGRAPEMLSGGLP
jgi:hypothetical protein